MPKRTKSGRKTAVADAEDKSRSAYGEGKETDRKAFGGLSKTGPKRGSKTAPKGARSAKSKRQ